LAEFDLGFEIDRLIDTARNWVPFCSPTDVSTEQLCLVELYLFINFSLDDYRGEIGKMCEWYHRRLVGGTLALDAPLMLYEYIPLMRLLCYPVLAEHRRAV
jgi:hypothetical protein